MSECSAKGDWPAGKYGRVKQYNLLQCTGSNDLRLKYEVSNTAGSIGLFYRWMIGQSSWPPRSMPRLPRAVTGGSGSVQRKWKAAASVCWLRPVSHTGPPVTSVAGEPLIAARMGFRQVGRGPRGGGGTSRAFEVNNQGEENLRRQTARKRRRDCLRGQSPPHPRMSPATRKRR